MLEKRAFLWMMVLRVLVLEFELELVQVWTVEKMMRY